MGNSDWCVVSFGSSNRWKGALSRLEKQSRRFGFDFLGVTEKSIDNYIPNLMESHQSFVHESRRGFGYWFWKPHLAMWAVQSLTKYRGILYLDAGCELNFNKNSAKKMDEFIANADTNGSLFFQMPFPESQFVKSS